MHRFMILLVIFLFFSAPGFAAQSKIEPSKADDIRRLLELSGNAKMGDQILDTMIEQVKPIQPSISEEFWREFRDSVSTDDLVDLMVPIYDRHFSHDEILDLIKFYSSPLGQRLVAELPLIVKESMAVGNEWGQKIGLQVLERMNTINSQAPEGTSGSPSTHEAEIGVETYFGSLPGQESILEGTVVRSGYEIRSTRTIRKVLPRVSMDEKDLLMTASEMTYSTASGESFSGSMEIFQFADQSLSCTYALQFPGKEPERFPCDYFDLKAPIRTGEAWESKTDVYLYNLEIAVPPEGTIHSKILGFGSLEASGEVFDDCIAVSETARVEPVELVKCDDGQMAEVSVDLSRTRWHCPGLPDFREETTEIYFRNSDPEDLCTTFNVVIETVSVGRPAQK